MLILVNIKASDKIHLFNKQSESIQGIITRKSSHCFLVKGWEFP